MPSSEESIAVHPLTTYSTSHVTTSTDRVTTTAGHVTGRISGKRVNSNGFFR